MTDERALADVLELDPAMHAGRIAAYVAARRGFGGAEERSDARDGSPTGSSVGREEVEARLSAMRDIFWDSDAASIRKSLSRMEVSAYPDLARAAERIARVNDARHEVAALKTDSRVPTRWFDAVQVIAIAASRDAARARDDFVRRASRDAPKRRLVGFIAAVREHAPTIAALEGPWLQRIQAAKKERRDSRVLKDGIGCFGAWLLGMIVLRIVRALIESFGGGGVQ